MIRGKYNKIVLEPHEEEFIKDNFFSMTNQELANALGLKLTKLRGFAYALGLKRMELEYWTETQVDFLKLNYKEIGDTELAEIFEIKWKKNKGWTKKHIEKKRRYLNLKRTTLEKKKIKHRNTQMGRFSECAKKKWETTGQAPIGEKRIWYHPDNTPFVVIKTKKGFVHYNPWLWKKHKGKIPDGFIVRNFSNKLLEVQITDLKLITREENAYLNTSNRLTPASREIKKLSNKLLRAIKTNENGK